MMKREDRSPQTIRLARYGAVEDESPKIHLGLVARSLGTRIPTTELSEGEYRVYRMGDWVVEMHGDMVSGVRPITPIERLRSLPAFLLRLAKRTSDGEPSNQPGAVPQGPRVRGGVVGVPRGGEALLWLLLKHEHRDGVLGDLQEDHLEAFKQFGRSYAFFWYWCQVGRSLFPIIAHAVFRVFLWWKGVKAISEILKRIAG